MSIPASAIVSIIPGVVTAGGNPLQFNGLILSQSTYLPVGAPTSFASATAVGAFFGMSSPEYNMASVYFAGFANGSKRPAALLFSRFSESALSAFLVSAQVPSLATLQAITAGALSVTIDGTVHSTTALNLAAASSYSAMAADIATALGLTGGATVTYSSQTNAFTITSGTTGATSSVAFAIGAAAATLGLTQATGAVLSPGAAAMTPASAMTAVLGYTQNWVSFSTAWEPVLTDKEAFSLWNGQQNSRYLYCPYDSDITITENSSTYAGLGAYLSAGAVGGVAVSYSDPLKSALIMGIIASQDFTEEKGRTTLAFQSQSGLVADVTSQGAAANVIANGVNFYGAYATANEGFIFIYPGQVSGQYAWIDSYYCQIWLNNQLQLAVLNLLTSVKQIPYNQRGRTLLRAACQDPITAALNYGAIQTGVSLSAEQAAIVNNQAGMAIDAILSTKGYYLQIKDATAQVRGLRQSPPMTLWYMDGGSVQQVNLNSLEVQ